MLPPRRCGGKGESGSWQASGGARCYRAVSSAPKRLLSLCSRNRLRSPTAEEIFARPGIETDSAGLSPEAEVVLDPAQIGWADLILVMEPVHKSRLQRDYGRFLKDKRVVVLGIPDRYERMQPELVALLETKCARHLA
jgi:predicted protein tyrosine phosphatase